MPPASPLDELRAIEAKLGLVHDFPETVMQEAEAWTRAAGIDDPTLIDRTSWPFVTIDGATSRDLDQALYVERDNKGYLVAYALADASYYIRPGSALFEEALKRGASYYFPGYSIPMLPRSLSEGIISLNPDGPRRSLLFLHRLNAEGQVLETRMERARVQSRAKLSFEQVQQLVDTPEISPLAGQAYETSLNLLREVGRLRLQIAANRGLVRYRREEVTVQLEGQGHRFRVLEMARDEVESWNEQLSLLCNSEGGRLLAETSLPGIEPIYRIQPAATDNSLAGFAKLTHSIRETWQLPEIPWVWKSESSTLADYLKNLPTGPAGSFEDRLAKAITRQAVMINQRSAYSTEPGLHSGVGAEPYARFSAPMREIVGVFLHKEAMEMLTGKDEVPEQEDQYLREAVVLSANRSRDLQKQVEKLSTVAVLNHLFEPELAADVAQRTFFSGTVMGIADNKVHVRLDTPPLDLKLYFFDLARSFNNAWLQTSDTGATLRAKGTETPLLRLGQTIKVVVNSRDEAKGRWLFDIVL